MQQGSDCEGLIRQTRANIAEMQQVAGGLLSTMRIGVQSALFGTRCSTSCQGATPDSCGQNSAIQYNKLKNLNFSNIGDLYMRCTLISSFWR